MVYGLHGHNGQTVLKAVLVAESLEPELVATLYPATEVKCVLEI